MTFKVCFTGSSLDDIPILSDPMPKKLPPSLMHSHLKPTAAMKTAHEKTMPKIHGMPGKNMKAPAKKGCSGGKDCVTIGK
eukprot:gene30718-59975_t